MDFETRYKALNDRQRQAVDAIDGPLMVIAGPGTGKTELLSMRTATILKKTDTLPESILCLTFTDSGASAMRQRLSTIIGPAAYKVAIHTFHSFSTEVINHNRKFFYNGATFQPADELNRFELLQQIFQELEPGNPLAATMNGTYTHLKDMSSVISELKSSGLTSAELLKILDANQQTIETIEALLVPLFTAGIKKGTIDALLELPARIEQAQADPGVPGVPTLAQVASASLAAALAEATADNNSTKPITAWKKAWFRKNEKGEYILKSRERQRKLRAACGVYDRFVSRMQEAGLFDFDDMILSVVHAMEVVPELRFNLQEKYLYIMVDEFQDTNLAQMRILLDLISNEVNEGQPNIMVVGDDDQAIYGFQGATVSNIHSFIAQFPEAPRIVLTDNYRSVEPILTHSRSVITLGKDRLETLLPGINKSLVAHQQKATSGEETPSRSDNSVTLTEWPSTIDERHSVVADISRRLQAGEPASSIAVLARRHHELVSLLPYFVKAGIKVNYERRDNVLELDSIQLIERIAHLLVALLDGRLAEANGQLPELLAHPAFGLAPHAIWQLSVRSQSERKSWLEIMPDQPDFAPLHDWLIFQSQAAASTPLERMIDIIIGTPETSAEQNNFLSPLYGFFFSPEKLEHDPALYLRHLNGLITIRSKLKEHHPDTAPTIRTFLDFLRLQRESGGTITSIQPASLDSGDAVTLMTAHKAKGLEFETVYITGAVDSAWGERARSKSRLIGYPENLPLQPPGDTLDDRLRLFYVAMTRARKTLHISYSTSDDNGKTQLCASFLTGEGWHPLSPDLPASPRDTLEAIELSWYQPIIRPLQPSMRELLLPKLENYKLNATHLSNFLDLTRGGPEGFLVNNLLKFPQAPSPHAGYGRAIHTALQRAHAHTVATGEQRPHEDILRDFETALNEQYLEPSDHEHFMQRGSMALNAFLANGSATFASNQKTELNFGGQGVVVGEASLTGILDVLETNESSVTITDYKTGKAVHNWKGTSDYEKIKLHRYRTQLLFYELLVRGSRDFSKYSVDSHVIQFVEPTKSGDIVSLEATFTDEECDRLRRLIQVVWRHIITLDMPDTSQFEPNYKGIVAFEAFLLDEHI